MPVLLTLDADTTKFVKAGGNESTITVNVTSTFLLALLLIPKLQQSGKISAVTPTLTIVSSEMHFTTAVSLNMRWPDIAELTSLKLPEKSAPSIFETLNDEKTARMMQRYPTSKLLEVFVCREIARLHSVDQLGVTINFVSKSCRPFKPHHPDRAILIYRRPRLVPQRASPRDGWCSLPRHYAGMLQNYRSWQSHTRQRWSSWEEVTRSVPER